MHKNLLMKFSLIALCFCLLSCQSKSHGRVEVQSENFKNEIIDMIYEGNGIKVYEVPKNTSEICAFYNWNAIDEEIAYQENDLIVVGKISNIRDVIIEYPFMGIISANKNTFFDVTISKILYADDDIHLKENDTFMLGVPYNSHDRADEYPLPEEGKEFLIFSCKTSEFEEYPLYKKEYLEYWCSSPEELMLEKIDNYYIGRDFFQSQTDVYYLYSDLKTLIDRSNDECPIDKTIFYEITQTLLKRDLLNTASSCSPDIYTIYESNNLENIIHEKAHILNERK